MLGQTFDDAGFAAALGGTVAAAVVAGAVFLAVVAAGDRATLTTLAGKLRPRPTIAADSTNGWGDRDE
jgi:hypothetical protein